MNAFIFPVTALLCAALGYALPGVFTPLKTLIVPLLITIMLGMGMTLTLRDFTDIFKKKRALALGVALQFIVMPLAGLGVSRLLNLNDELTAGMMLVGTSAGGTASNVITYLARGNVALSVSMTLCSTLLSIVLMPLLTWLYIGQKVPVPATDMLIDLVKITLVPLAVGVSLNTFAHRVVARLQSALPAVSIGAIVLIIAIVVALNHANVEKVGLTVVFAVMAHNAAGLICGYLGARALGFDERIARTISIEVGMQNSGLSVALAIKYFSGLSALPGAIFSIWHNVSGALLAGFWASRSQKRDKKRKT